MRNTQTESISYAQDSGAPHQSAIEAAQMALEAALDRKALEPVLLDVRKMCSYTEYILLVSGRSDRQVDAIADAVSHALRGEGRRPLGVEGASSGQWALLDFGDVVIHVFHHPQRLHYDLESLWHEAPRVDIEVPDEARATPDDLY
ncbi:MAG TPA: ribosome silencing factor [Kofleriaceae bacterium]|nr:ribosome silencing factor [Kofleriaceae bacterium]